MSTLPFHANTLLFALSSSPTTTLHKYTGHCPNQSVRSILYTHTHIYTQFYSYLTTAGRSRQWWQWSEGHHYISTPYWSDRIKTKTSTELLGLLMLIIETRRHYYGPPKSYEIRNFPSKEAHATNKTERRLDSILIVAAVGCSHGRWLFHSALLFDRFSCCCCSQTREVPSDESSGK